MLIKLIEKNKYYTKLIKITKTTLINTNQLVIAPCFSSIFSLINKKIKYIFFRYLCMYMCNNYIFV